MVAHKPNTLAPAPAPGMTSWSTQAEHMERPHTSTDDKLQMVTAMGSDSSGTGRVLVIHKQNFGGHMASRKNWTQNEVKF